MTAYLITGGAGFIGSHLADELLSRGHQVRVLDDLVEQVHGDRGGWPGYLSDGVERLSGDIRDPEVIRRAIDGVDGVFHLAARVGVGQSMYQIDEYTSVNDLGTAVLLQELIARPVRRLVVASSMSVYGEGLYVDGRGREVADAGRNEAAVRSGTWDPLAADGSPLEPVPTPERKPVDLASVYALGKYVQERMCMIVARAYGFEAAALRLFNVYGPRQALSNPYTGVLAIFGSRLLNGRAPMVFEDGRQRRDFVHVADVAKAFRLAMEVPEADGRVLNIGSGRSVAIADLAAIVAERLGHPELLPEITCKARIGDIRHCFADISEARAVLGFEPGHSLEKGLEDTLNWLAGERAVDRVDQATDELRSRGLVA